MANVHARALHKLGIDDMKTFGDSTAPLNLHAVDRMT